MTSSHRPEPREACDIQRPPRRWLRLALASVCIALGALGWMAFGPSAVPSFSAVKARWQPSDAYLLDRNGEVLDDLRVDFRVRRLPWTPLEAVSPALISAIVDGEDRRFWQHSGVDVQALLSALRDRGFADRRRGASTISMQVAALLDPSVRAGNSHGAWQRKLAQMRRARALEASWTKREILEAYLNLLGFHGELQGIGAASQVLAGKAPAGLSLPESLVLAALLPAPRAAADRVVARACARAASRHLDIECASIGACATAMLSQATRQPAAVHLAPQLARALLRKPGESVQTTLDANVQRLAHAALAQHLAALTTRNVRDGAVLVVENETGKVLAYVGSAGPQSRAREVDGVRAHRQAGSTLKPFLYQMAIERRYLTAASLLNDSPITLDTASGIYLPQNYDRDFKGLVSVRTALGSSLNVPAVRTLMLVGVESFRGRLYELGYGGLTQPGDFYGYSLALGSAEVSLWEQVQAYRTLARGGQSSPLRVVEPDVTSHARRPATLLSADATYIVADILSDRAARTVTFGMDNYLNTPFWTAVKTGTSKDMRDNWCIGFSRDFTVGVWVGNFEGDSMRDVSGITGAAPVWQQIMIALHVGRPSAPPPTPQGVRTATARFSPSVEPTRTERFLLAASAAPAPTQPLEIAAASDIAKIASPANGMVIALDPDIPPGHQRVPLTARGTEAGMILRLDGLALGTASQNVLWPPTRGAHILALEDSAGHTLDSAHFTVR